MVGWHHQLKTHEFEQTPGNGEGQEAWHATVSPWGCGVRHLHIQIHNTDS